MSSVFNRKLIVPLWGMAIFAVALMAPMPAMPFLLLVLVAALVVTMRGVRGGVTVVQEPHVLPRGRAKGSLRT